MSKRESIFKKLWRKIGPGIITGASDDDPSGIAIYGITGAKSGYNFLWAPLFTLPFMVTMQELCGKIALATKKGVAGAIKSVVHPYIAYSVAILMFFANTFNVAADLRAISDSLNLITNAENGLPFSALKINFSAVSTEFWLIASALFIVLAIIFLSYKKLAVVLKFLTITLFAYIGSALFIKVNWLTVFNHTFIPRIPLSKESFLIIAALFGTTISPYLFFWQSDEEVEEIENRPNLKPKKIRREIRKMRADTFLGMFISNLVAFFIILASASILYNSSSSFAADGISSLTIKDIAETLRPIAGDFSYFLFVLAVIGTGFLAIPVLAGGAAYILSEVFGFPACMNKRLKDAKFFYLAISSSVFLGLLLAFLPIKTMDFLFYTGVMFAILSPLVIFLILFVSNKKKIMGEYRNSILENTLGIITLIIALAISVMSFL